MASRAHAAIWVFALSILVITFLPASRADAKSVTQITAIPLDSTAGDEAIYEIALVSDSTVQPNDKMRFEFQAGFNVANVVVSQAISGIDGGFTISINGQQVILGRDNTGSPILPGTPIRVRFGTIGNPTVAGGAYTIEAAVLSSTNALKDGPDTSAPFTIVSAALDHFSVRDVDSSDIDTQTADVAFPIRIVAQDRFNNTVTSFSNTVTLADPTGTLSPATSSSFVSGVLASQNVTISTAGINLTITVSGNGKNGVSNSFTVTHGPLDHFSLDAIGSPQKAGIGFPVTITARDASNNTVSSFSQNVTILISAGTVSPTTSGVFVSGTRTEVISVLSAGSNLVISVSDGAAHTGVSNSFNVTPGDLDHFEVTATGGGNIGPQNVSIPFNIRIVARDRYDNIVTGFSGSVTLSDSTRTISPSISSTFSAGILATQSVTISKADSNDAITASGNGKSGTSNVFTVRAGPLHHIVLRTAPNNGGEIFAAHTMTADDSVFVYAAGYDLGDSYLGDVSVSWSSNGGLAPAVSGSGSSYLFKPTTASISGTTGQIIGTHAVGSDATGIITVKPGAPSGVVALTPSPAVVPADGASTSTITSAVIMDEDGNAVGPGRQFSIIVPTVGTIPDTQDVNAGRSGIQIATNSASRLSFIFVAGLLGGIANINIASDQGSAVGSTSIVVGSINITSINAPEKISRGQSGVLVSMGVQNIGASPIVDLAGSLSFFGSGNINRNADYPTVTRVDTFTTIPAAEIRTLLFSVNVSATATIDTVTINGSVSGKIAGSLVSDAGAESTDSWLVQKKAAITVQSVTAPDSVAQGQTGVNVTVVVANNLGDPQSATARLDSVQLFFKRGGSDISAQYIYAAAGSNPDTIAGGGQAMLTFTMNVGAAADTGQITLDARAFARDANSGAALSDVNGANAPAAFFVSPAAALQIVSMTPTQGEVTVGMLKPWAVKVAVRNNSSSTIQLDLAATKSYIRFFQGSNEISSEYQVSQPGQLVNSGNNILGPTTTDILEYTITQTGTTTGTIIITGRVAGTVLGPGLPIADDTQDGGKGQVIVQTLAGLRISSIGFSQATATSGQVKPWDILVNLQNTGGSAVRVVFSTDSTNIFLAQSAGYAITPPVKLGGGGTELPANGSAFLAYRVDTTGNALGSNTVLARVYGYEINSGRSLSDSTEALRAGTFLIQSPPLLRIVQTRLDSVTAPNAPFVNRRQNFQIKVLVENGGQEQADSVVVALTSDDTSSISAQMPAFTTIAGLAQREVAFAITAADTPGVGKFSARIDTARGHNTGLRPAELPAVDDSASIIRQKPAALAILAVTPSDSIVSANQITPWEIYVGVADTGNAGIRFQPDISDVAFKINGATRNDFVVEAPAKLKGRADLTLPGGIRDTLVYRVTRTGTQGGDAQIIVAVNGVDINNAQPLNAADTGAVAVEINAAVRVFATSARTNNYAAQGDALVNTGQLFKIMVVVENTGLEPVRDVLVELTTNGGASIPTPRLVIPNIGAQTSDSLFFDVVAASQVNLPGELFKAIPLSAVATQSGRAARILSAIDDEARVITQQAAALSIAVFSSPLDGKLSVGQSFLVSGFVSNSGNAGIDNSGQISLRVPAGYAVVEPLVRSFAVGVQIDWQVTAPGAPSGPDTFQVAFANVPRDVNSNLPANVAVAARDIIVETDTTNLRIDSLFVSAPAGAMDDTVSTEQFFTVQAQINRSSNLPAASAVLRLPPGFSFRFGAADSLRALGRGENGPAWEIQAPVDPTPGADQIILKVTAPDGQAQVRTARDTLAIVAVLKAELQVQASIISPAGAESGLLRKGQKFTLRALLQNVGEARTEGEARVKLSLGSTNVSTQEVLEKIIEVNNFVDWQLQAPLSSITQQPLIVEISKTPRDENRNLPAVRIQSRFEILISTREKGFLQVSPIEITGPAGATDSTVSTEQTFTLGSTMSWSNARDLQAELFFPKGQGFSVIPPESKIILLSEANPNAGNEFLAWTIQAPKTEITRAGLVVVFSGRDAADTTQFAVRSDTLRVNVVNKAALALTAQITSPLSATDGTVTTEQIFTVRAALTNQGTAGTTGSTTLQLTLPPGGYEALDALAKSTAGDSVAWQVKAPATPHDGFRIMQIRVLGKPRDENSQDEVSITPLEVQVGVQTEKNSLLVQQIAMPRSSTVVRGQEEVPVLRLSFENIGNATSSNFLLKKLIFTSVDATGAPLNTADVLAALKIRRLSDNQILAQKAGASGAAKLELEFAQGLLLLPSRPQTLDVLLDIAQNPALVAFRLLLEKGTSIEAIDEDSGVQVGVEVRNLAGENVALDTDKIVVIERGLAKSFMNYPNPFGTADKPATVFTYFLDANSDVALRIFTLFGELVWERAYHATDPEGRADGIPKSIIWTGVNGKGKQVLNGVYLAVLSTKNGTVTTKVAVLR